MASRPAKLRALGVLAIAALAWLALIGADKSSATVLCTAQPEVEKEVLVCPEGAKYDEGPIRAKLAPATQALFVDAEAGEELVYILCSESELSGEITQPGGVENDVQALISKMTFSHQGKPSCPKQIGGALVAFQNLPYAPLTVSYQAVTLPHGQVALEGSEKPAEFTLNGSFGCRYRAMSEPLFGEYGLEGHPTRLRLSSWNFELVSGGLCFESLRLQADYELGGEEEEKEVDLYVARK